MPTDAVKYALFADRFGWTPDQVDDLRMPLADDLLPVLGVIDAVRNEQMKKETPSTG